MSIKHINTDDLRRMNDKEGLVIMGCGGPLQEWLDGINDTLAKAEILQKAFQLRDVKRHLLKDNELKYLSAWWTIVVRALIEVKHGNVDIPEGVSEEDFHKVMNNVVEALEQACAEKLG